MSNSVFEHISVFEQSAPEVQMRAMVRFIIQQEYMSERDFSALSWRIDKYAKKVGISHPQAAEQVRDEVRRVIEARLENVH